MLLKQVFPVDRIKLDLESDDKDELFEELGEFLAQATKRALERDQVVRALEERESKMATGIKTGIALPHGKIEGIEGSVGVIGVSKKGIDYASLDGEPVYVVFLLLSSLKAPEQHLRVLRRIAVLLDDPAFLDSLMSARDPLSAFKTLERFEETLIREG